MPYIAHERRAALNVIIDSIVKAIREERLQCNIVRYIAYNLSAFCMGFPPLTHTDSVYPTDGKIVELMYSLMDRLQEIGCTRGDVNYTLTRIVLESLKPEAGWGYHSLSDCVALMRNVSDVMLKIEDDTWRVWRAASIPRDVADEIARRLLGPYEDTAILKNGDMECFQESFAHKPVDKSRDRFQEETRDAYEAYRASCGGSPPPPGYPHIGLAVVESEAEKYMRQFVVSNPLPLEQVSGCMADAIEKDREEIRKQGTDETQ